MRGMWRMLRSHHLCLTKYIYEKTVCVGGCCKCAWLVCGILGWDHRPWALLAYRCCYWGEGSQVVISWCTWLTSVGKSKKTCEGEQWVCPDPYLGYY